MNLDLKRTLPSWLLLAALIFGMASQQVVVHAQTPAPENLVHIYLFYGEGCPHCAQAQPFFKGLADQYDGVILKTFEVYYNEENQQIFTDIAQKYGVEQMVVPMFFIGPYYLPGYSEEYDDAIEAVVVQCLQEGCIDAGEDIAGLLADPSPTVTPQSQKTPTPTPTLPATKTDQSPLPTNQPTVQPQTLSQSHQLHIPLFGTIDLDMQSTVLSTALIAFMDSFNPCSLWVLSMLMALTIHTGSRKKVLIIGLVFLTVTSVIYALFIAGLFSVLKFASLLGWVQIAVGLIALFIGLVNIKDYFWYKEGLTFTIAEEKKKGIFKSMRRVIDASQSFWGLMGATVLLAAGVSMVEFSCTAGLPVVWVNLLNGQNISGISFLLLLLLYMLVYQIETLLIFSTAVISLKASRVQEKQGRVLKLIGGMLMLTLSVVMIVKPALMNNLGSSLLIFGVAFLVTLLVLLIHRVILPKFGIRIGTEPARKGKVS